MKRMERKQKIDSYGQAYQKLVFALERFPGEMWHFRPGQNRWTIHEIIIHITDSERTAIFSAAVSWLNPGARF